MKEKIIPSGLKLSSASFLKYFIKQRAKNESITGNGERQYSLVINQDDKL